MRLFGKNPLSLFSTSVTSEDEISKLQPTEAQVIGDISGVDIHTNGACERAILRVACAAHRLGRRPDVMQKLRNAHAAIYLIPKGMKLTELPEFRSLAGQKTIDGRGWEEVTAVTTLRQDRTIAAVSEEELLKNPQYDMAVHELGHIIKYVGLTDNERAQIRAQYLNQKSQGFKDSYAANNEDEWFANGTGAWFGASNTNVANGNDWFEQNGTCATSSLMKAVYGNAVGLPSSLPQRVNGIELSLGEVAEEICSQVEKAALLTGARPDIAARLTANQVCLVMPREGLGLEGLPEASGMNGPPEPGSQWRFPERLEDGRLVSLVSPNKANTLSRSFGMLASALYQVGITDEERKKVDALCSKKVGVGILTPNIPQSPELYFSTLAQQWLKPELRSQIRPKFPEITELLDSIYPALAPR